MGQKARLQASITSAPYPSGPGVCSSGVLVRGVAGAIRGALLLRGPSRNHV